MNNLELKSKVNALMESYLKENGYVKSINILLGLNIISLKDYEDFRQGKIPYLEKVCKTNLNKLLLILKEMLSYAKEKNLNRVINVYKGIEKNRNHTLYFSKSRSKYLEDLYASTYKIKKQIK